MKLESLVTAHQHGAVNTFPGLVHTARHTIRAGGTRSRQSNRKGDAVEGTLCEGGEVVTRESYRKVRLDHLLFQGKRDAQCTRATRMCRRMLSARECFQTVSAFFLSLCPLSSKHVRLLSNTGQ